MLGSHKDKNNRFHKITFTHRLKTAQNYKRPVRPVPESPWAVFFAQFGFKSGVAFMLAVICIAALSYLSFFHNFLWVQKVEVHATNTTIEHQVKDSVDIFLAGKALRLFPRANFFAISKRNLQWRIQQDVLAVKQVSIIIHPLTRVLEIRVTPRKEQFLVTTKQASFILFDDGVVAKRLEETTATASETAARLISLQIDAPISADVGASLLQKSDMENIAFVHSVLSGQMHLPVVKYELFLPGFIPPEVPTASTTPRSASIFSDHVSPEDILVILSGTNSTFAIYLPSTQKLSGAVNRFVSLWGQLDEARIKNLSYIDMRLEHRGFLCLRNTPCARVLSPEAAQPN